jgi:hypothetical protein
MPMEMDPSHVQYKHLTLTKINIHFSIDLQVNIHLSIYLPMYIAYLPQK